MSIVPPTEAAGDPRTFSALGSSVRMRILQSLSTKEKSIGDLARELDLNPVTLRYHLLYLRNQGLVREVLPTGPHKVGRPAVLYRTSERAHVPGFPQRHFELLGQAALDALVEAVGKEAASVYLRRRGLEIGRAMIREAPVPTGSWTPDTFEHVVLEGLFRGFGIPTEVQGKSRTVLTYRSFSCPFLELAEKRPDLVCNAMDAGFHAGIEEAIGGVRTERLACMGHGDPYCEYTLTWAEGDGPDRTVEAGADRTRKEASEVHGRRRKE